MIEGGPESYALIIGIGSYRDERIPPLRFVHSDAEAFKATLTDPTRGCFKPEHVRTLLDDQATAYNIKHHISGWLFKEASANSTVVVIFAGHGHMESDRLGIEKDGMAKYLLPWDASPDNLFASAISNNEFNRLLSTVKAKRMVIFMDACYSGGLSTTGAGSRDIGMVEDPFKKLTEGEGRIVIAAAKPNQRSWEDESIGHGIFTHHLIEALSGKADSDGDGYVSILEVFRYLEEHVPDSARRLANSLQEPLLWGDVAKDIRLTVNTEKIRQLKAELDKERAERKAQLKRAREATFQLLTDGKIDTPTSQKILELIEREPEPLMPRERTAVGLLEAVMRGAVDASLLVDAVQVAAAARDAAPRARFCTNCGATAKAGAKFCTGCGAQLRVQG